MKLASLVFLATFLWSSNAIADQLRVISVGTVAPAMKLIIPAFEKTTGHSVQITYGNPGATVRKLREDSTADVGLIPQSGWNEAKATNTFDELNRVLIAKTKIGAATKAGSAPINLSDVDAIKTTMTKAAAICMGDPNAGSPASVALFKAFDKLGISDQVRPKAKYFVTGELVGEAIAHGDCEIGITTLSELRSVAGIAVAGALPAEIIDFAPVTYALPLNGSRKPELARQFIGFLSSQSARQVFKSTGLDPES